MGGLERLFQDGTSLGRATKTVAQRWPPLATKCNLGDQCQDSSLVPTLQLWLGNMKTTAKCLCGKLRLRYPRLMHPRSPASLALGVAAVVTVVSSAMATLNYDLRATGLNGVPLPAHCAQGGFPLAVGDTVTLTVYAQITGTAGDSALEGVQFCYFSLISSTTPGQMQGFFTTGTVLPAFATGLFNGGTPTDTNADGINDRLGGQRNTSAQAAAPFDISVRAGSLPNYAGTPILNGQEFALMTADWHVINVGNGRGGVNVAPSIFTSGLGSARFSAAWAENAATTSTTANRNSGFNGLNPPANGANTGTITIGFGFGSALDVFDCPEPSPLGMLLLGAIWITGSRRIRVQRQ